MSASGGAFTPKQRAKRAQIVDAAVETMKLHGLHSCTVRTIAATACVPKAILHYYFDDVDEIVNAAFLQLTRSYVTIVEARAARNADPVDAFWQLLAGYLKPFEAHRSVSMLWFEYASWAMANDHSAEVSQSVRLIDSMFQQQLDTIDRAGAQPRSARALVRYLLGTILDLSAHVISFGEVFVDVAVLCRLEPPVPSQVLVSHDAACPLCQRRGAGEVAPAANEGSDLQK